MATTTQILSGRIKDYSTSATRYVCLDTGGSAADTTDALAAGIIAKAGNLSNLRLNISAAPGEGKSFTYTVYKNGVATLLTAAISNTNTTATCSEEISVAAGDTISLQIVPYGTPTASTVTTFACNFSTTTNNTLLMGTSGAANISVNSFAAVKGRVPGVTTENTNELLIPCDGVISDFYLKSHIASGAEKTVTYTVRKNGVNTTLLISLTGASDKTGNDTIHSFSVSAGDTVCIQKTGDTTTQYVSFGLVFTPTIVGNFIIGIIPSSATLNRIDACFTSINAYPIAFFVPENLYAQNFNSCTIKNIYIKLSTTPSATQIFTLRKNASDTALTVSIDSSSTTGTASEDITISDDDIVSTGKNATASQTGRSFLISYTGYRVDKSTYQSTLLSDMVIKTVNQETVISDMKIIADRVQETINSDMIVKTVNSETIESDMKIKVLGTQKTLTSDMYISHSLLKSIVSDMVIKKIDIINNLNSNMIIKVTDKQNNLISNMIIKQRNQETLSSDMRIAIIYNGKFIHNSDLFIITDTTPAQLIKVDLTNPAVYTKYILTGYTNGKAAVINHTTETIYISLAGGYVLAINTNDPTIQTVHYIGENVQLYSIAHNPTYLTTFIADSLVDDSLFVIDEGIYDKINSDIRTRIEAKKLINTWIGTITGTKINSDIRTRILEKYTLNTDLRFNNSIYSEVSLLSRTDFHVYIDGIELGNDDLKLDSITIAHIADNKDTADFILTRKHDEINTPTTITNNNIVTIYLGTRLEYTGKIIKLDCNSQSEYVKVYTSSDTIMPDYNIVVKDLPLSTLNTQLHPYDILLGDISIDNPYVNTTLVIIGKNNSKYWSGTGWVYEVSQALTFATVSLANSYILNRTDTFFLEQTPRIENYEENSQYYKGIKINLGTQITQNVEQWYVMEGEYKMSEDLEAGTFKFKPNYTYFWDVQVNWSNLNGAMRLFGWQYIGTSLSPLCTDLYEITKARAKYQKISDDFEEDLGYYFLGVAPYKEVSAKNGKKICKPKWEDRADGLYTIIDARYDYQAYCKDVASIEYEKIKNINDAIFPKTSANIDLTIDGYLYYRIKLLTRVNITNTTTTDIYKNLNGFPISVKQITINSDSMKVSIVADNIKSNWELERISNRYPVEPKEISESITKEHTKFDFVNQEEIDGIVDDTDGEEIDE